MAKTAASDLARDYGLGFEIQTWNKWPHSSMPQWEKVFHYSTSWTGFKSCLPLPEFLRHPPLVTFSDTVWAESPRSCRTYDKMPTNRL